MSEELDKLIDESVFIRNGIQKMQTEYDAKRARIFEILKENDLKTYQHDRFKASARDAISIESVSKELLIKALQEVEIPREQKVFIWNRSIKEVTRPAMVVIQEIRSYDK